MMWPFEVSITEFVLQKCSQINLAYCLHCT